MSKPDHGHVTGPAPAGSVPGPTISGTEYVVTVTAAPGRAGHPRFASAIPSDGPLRVSFDIGRSRAAGVSTGTLTFSSPGKSVAVVSTTYDESPLAAGQSCTITVKVLPATRSGAPVAVPASTALKFSASSVLKAELNSTRK